jgi:hypothetical protein
MSWYRSKRMSETQLASFRAKYEQLYAAIRDNADMAVLAHDHAGGDTTVLIPFARSGLVESYSPGDWADEKSPETSQWRFLCGCASARMATSLTRAGILDRLEPRYSSEVSALV